MIQTKRNNRVDVAQENITRLLASLKEQGKPLILTEGGRGVAAIVPYTDPESLPKNTAHKKI
jgi:antitoxin (DNA-binding transcriptional repressor) of toxin-antitoxin stability system